MKKFFNYSKNLRYSAAPQLLSVFVIIVAILWIAWATFPADIADANPAFGVTNYDRLYLADSSTGPILNVRQNGTGDIVRFLDGSTTVWSIADGGGVTQTGDYTNTGALLIDGAEDEVQLTVQGYTTQTNAALVVETSAGTDTFVVDGSGNITTMGEFDEAILVDGEADEVQLTVSGYTTQTAHTFVVEQSDGTDVFWVDNSGDTEINGTTPALTIGDAGEEDTSIVFDGAAQDFYVGLDDTADDLVVGLGSALGTTLAFAVDENQVTTWTGGTIKLAETATTTDTLTAAECGKTVFIGDEMTLTLPAISTVVAGCEFRFVAPSDITTSTIVLTGNSTEDVLAGGINELEVDTGDDGPYDANADTITFVGGTAVIGDFVYMISDGSMFFVSGQANADGGITITDSD